MFVYCFGALGDLNLGLVQQGLDVFMWRALIVMVIVQS